MIDVDDNMTRENSMPHVPDSQVNQPVWVGDMVRHHERTGVYRAEDILRLLGDPRDCVEVKITTAPSFSLAAGIGDHQTR